MTEGTWGFWGISIFSHLFFVYPRNLSSGLTVIIDVPQTWVTILFQQGEVLPKCSLTAKWTFFIFWVKIWGVWQQISNCEKFISQTIKGRKICSIYCENENETINRKQTQKMSKKTHVESTQDRPTARNILILKAASAAPTTKTISYLAKVVNYALGYHPVQTIWNNMYILLAVLKGMWLFWYTMLSLMVWNYQISKAEKLKCLKSLSEGGGI